MHRSTQRSDDRLEAAGECPPSLDGEGDTTPRRLPAAAVSVLCLMQLMLVIDTSVVNVALPAIRQDLGFRTEALSWVVTSYALVFGGLVLVSGRIGAVIGSRRALLIGATTFVLASVLGGCASTSEVLLAARSLQGVGAALAAPSTLVLILNITPPGPLRTRALSVFVIAIGSGAALGLVLGGLLTSAFGWRAVMFVNVPVGLAVLLGVPRLVAETPRRPAAIDLRGAVSSTTTMGALVYGLTTAASAGWGDTSVLTALAVAAAGLVALVLVEARHPDPVVPLDLFTSARTAGPLVAMLLIPAGQFGFLFFAVLFAQDVLRYDALRTGLFALPFTAALLVVNALLTPRLVGAVGEHAVGATGIAALTGGLLWMSRLDQHSTFMSGLLGPFVLVGLGAGLTVAPLTAVIMGPASPEVASTASSLTQAMQQLGGSLGLAVLGTVFASASGQDGSSVADGIAAALLLAACFPLAACAFFLLSARRPGR